MKKLLLLPFSVLALTAFMACQTARVADKPETTKTENQVAQTQTTPPPTTDDHGHADEAPRINVEQAKKDFDGGSVVFVDTRSAEAFNNEHIKGAINIPAGQAATRYKEIPTGKKIIAYCT